MVAIKQCLLMASTFLVQNQRIFLQDHFCLDQSTQEQLRVSGTVTLESGISKFNKHLLRMQKQTIMSQITCAYEDEVKVHALLQD
jgi:hypothetical protein